MHGILNLAPFTKSAVRFFVIVDGFYKREVHCKLAYHHLLDILKLIIQQDWIHTLIGACESVIVS